MGELPDKGFKNDKEYFIATLEEGELAMKPFCSCGNHLEEDYYCDQCNKQCLCITIFCTDDETLAKVQHFIDNSESFKKFQASLLPEK